MKRKLLSLVLGLTLVTGLATLPVTAQNPPADNGGGGNNGGGGGGNRNRNRNFDPAKRMEDLKTQLGATDEEFKVIQPKIEKISELRRAQFAGAFGGFGRNRNGGGAGGGGGEAAPATENPVAKASAELKTAVDSKESTPEVIKEKLAALRAARAKAKEELTKAQAALKDVVTVRQEAVLVAQGYLE